MGWRREFGECRFDLLLRIKAIPDIQAQRFWELKVNGLTARCFTFFAPRLACFF